MQLYYCFTHDFCDTEGDDLLSPAGREKKNRYMLVNDRILYTVSRLMLRKIFGDGYESDLKYTKHSKPVFRTGDIGFNVSHSHKCVVVGVAPGDIGVDVEKVRPYRQSVAKRCFTERELMWLASQSSDNAFFKLWTGKESVMKCTALGFALPPADFDIYPSQNIEHHILGERFYLHWHSVGGYEMCVATRHLPGDLKIIELKKHDIAK